MGELGTKLYKESATKIVAMKVMDKEDWYEIAYVCGENEDFERKYLLPNTPANFTKNDVDIYAYRYNIPVYVCIIPHSSQDMTKEDVFKKIIGVTEPWECELKPCAFCENKAMVTTSVTKIQDITVENKFVIKCTDCPAEMQFKGKLTKNNAIGIWNYRKTKK